MAGWRILTDRSRGRVERRRGCGTEYAAGRSFAAGDRQDRHQPDAEEDQGGRRIPQQSPTGVPCGRPGILSGIIGPGRWQMRTSGLTNFIEAAHDLAVGRPIKLDFQDHCSNSEQDCPDGEPDGRDRE